MDTAKVFISHATEDNLFVEQLHAYLDNQGLDIWVDFEHMNRGGLASQIGKEIVARQFGIFVFSSISVKKPWFEREYNAFLNKNPAGIFLPVLLNCGIESLPPKYGLARGDHAYSFSAGNELVRDEAEKLIHAILGDQTPPAGFYFYDCEHIDLVLSRKDPSDFEKQWVSDLAKKVPAYKTHFFSQLNHPTWFIWLKRLGWFRLYDDKMNGNSLGGPRKPRGHSDFSIYQYLSRVAAALNEPEMVPLQAEFWDIFHEANRLLSQTRREGLAYYAVDKYPDVLAQAPVHLIPTDLILDASKWKNPDLLPLDLLTDLIPALLKEENIASERLSAIETLLKACLVVKTKSDTISLGVSWFWLKSMWPEEPFMSRLATVCSRDWVQFLADQVVHAGLSKRNSGTLIFPPQSRHAYEMTIHITSPREVDVKLYWIDSEAFQERQQKWAGQFGGETYLMRMPFPEGHKEAISTFPISFRSQEELYDLLEQALDRRNLLEQKPNLRSKLTTVLNRAFSDPFLKPIGPASLRKLAKKWHDRNDPLTVPLRFLLNLLEAMGSARPEEARKILADFLSPSYPWLTLKRIALEVINQHWERYRDLFWDWLASDLPESPFLCRSLEPELAYIMTERSSAFSPEEKALLLQRLEADVSDTYERLRWLSPLTEDSDIAPHFQALVQDWEGAAPKLEPEGPEVRIRSGRVPPISPQALLDLQGESLATYLRDFRGSGEWPPGEIPGLADGLTQAIAMQPEWIIPALPYLRQVYYVYGGAIAQGFEQVAKEGSDIPWREVIQFFIDYIEQDAFWQDQFTLAEELDTATHERAIYHIIELCAQLARKPVRDHISRSIKTLIALLHQLFSHMPFDPVEASDDAVQRAVNTQGGRALLVLLDVSLFKATLDFPDSQDGEVRWDSELRHRWTARLEEAYLPAFTLTGRYLHELWGLDSRWAQAQLTQASTLARPLWDAFIQGYFFSGQIYEGIYHLMRPHFERVFADMLPVWRTPSDESQARHPLQTDERFVQQLTVAYLQGWEKEEGLWPRLIDGLTPPEARWIIYLCQKQPLPGAWAAADATFYETVNYRILVLWGDLHMRLRAKGDLLSEDMSRIAGLTGLLLDRLPDLEGPHFSWCLFAIQHLQVDQYLENDYLRAFLSLKERLGADIRLPLARLFAALTQAEHFPDHPEPAVEELLLWLWDEGRAGTDEWVREICHAYAVAGFSRLVDDIGPRI